MNPRRLFPLAALVCAIDRSTSETTSLRSAGSVSVPPTTVILPATDPEASDAAEDASSVPARSVVPRESSAMIRATGWSMREVDESCITSSTTSPMKKTGSSSWVTKLKKLVADACWMEIRASASMERKFQYEPKSILSKDFLPTQTKRN